MTRSVEATATSTVSAADSQARELRTPGERAFRSPVSHPQAPEASEPQQPAIPKYPRLHASPTPLLLFCWCVR